MLTIQMFINTCNCLINKNCKGKTIWGRVQLQGFSNVGKFYNVTIKQFENLKRNQWSNWCMDPIRLICGISGLSITI